MGSDQNEIECFEIETTIRVTAASAVAKTMHFDREYRQASQSAAKQQG
nr:hypothetical protein [uncultured Janthinobacterium sp.]